MDEKKLGSEEKKLLLKLARSAIAESLHLEHSRPAATGSPLLEEKRGAFVTLHKHGRLRGCIGNFVGTGPLTETVEDMARSAAFEDPRFPSLKPGELDEVDLEISVLTPMRRIGDPAEVEVGRHGVYVVNGPYRGVLLPQVATEQGWDRETFLDHTCLKAGLDPGCWRSPQTEIYVFSAEVFGEKGME